MSFLHILTFPRPNTVDNFSYHLMNIIILFNFSFSLKKGDEDYFVAYNL